MYARWSMPLKVKDPLPCTVAELKTLLHVCVYLLILPSHCVCDHDDGDDDEGDVAVCRHQSQMELCWMALYGHGAAG